MHHVTTHRSLAHVRRPGRLALALCTVAMLTLGTAADDGPKETETDPKPPVPAALTHVVLTTSKGDIMIRLEAEKAPLSVENFLAYVADGSYDGTVFHRVIPTFMIQGGGFTAQMQQRATRGPIRNEGANSLRNVRGSVAMARLPAPDTATRQFFINVRDNPNLDHNAELNQPGYAVFGHVVVGMEVVDEIRVVATGARGGHRDVPIEPVVIERVRAIDDEAAAAWRKKAEAKADEETDGATDNSASDAP